MRTTLEQDLLYVNQELEYLVRHMSGLVIQQEDIDCELHKCDRRREMLEQEKAIIQTQIEIAHDKNEGYA
jgi:hypothetical protein